MAARLVLLAAAAIALSAVPASAQGRAAADSARDSTATRGQALPGVIVTGRRGEAATRGYQARRTSTATRTDTPLRDVPQAVTVVTGQLIADQAMQSMADVTRYVPGVTMGQGEGNRDQPTLRGNGSTADFFVNGLRDDVEYFRDLYNTERVEVLKGPNAMVFGRGGGGGVINRVLKDAGWAPVRSFSLQGGAYDDKRGTADVGGAFGSRLALRLNGMYENSGSYRDYVRLDRRGIYPAVTIAAGGRTTARINYEYFSDHRTADRGVPSFEGRPLRTDAATYFGNPDVSYVDAEVGAVNSRLEHELGSGLTIRNATRYADYHKFYQNVFPGAVDASGSRVSITGYNNRMRRRNLLNQTDVTHVLRVGGIKHVLLGGAELARQSTDAFRNTAYFANDATSLPTPLRSPTVDAPVTFRQSATDANAHTVGTVAAAYVQDQLELSPRLQAIVGLRYDAFTLRYHNNRDGSELSRTDRLLSPRVGLVLKPIAAASLYGSYSISHLPGSGNQFTTLSVTTRTLEPERFTNYEVGAKWDVGPAVSLNTAVYRLERTNTTAQDPNDATRLVQTGRQRSDGAEFGASGSVTRAWQVVAGYGYQDVRITSATTAAKPGARVALTPRHTVSLWNKYQATRSLGLGVGVVGQSRMFAAIDNRVTLPGFARADAAVYWSVTDRVRAQVNVENLFDRSYFPTANNNNNITPASPRAARVLLTSAF